MTTRLNFAAYDYDTMVQQLQDIVKNKSLWQDIYASGMGQSLIELFAYLEELMMYMIERRAQESYINTAQLRSSIINLVKLLNYSPSRNQSATGTVEFTLATAWPKNIIIPRLTKMSSANGTEYLTDEEVVLIAGQLDIEVPTFQGKIVTAVYTSTGDQNMEFRVDDLKVENTRFNLYVDDVLWTNVSSFVEAQGNSQVYRLAQNLDDTISIFFGDGRFGGIPPAGATINFVYTQSEGSAGNVFATSGVITTLIDTIVDVDDNPVTLTVDNTSKFLNGDDIETTEEIRYNAPRVFKTGDRAVTKDDYNAIIGDYPGVQTVFVWGEREESPPNIAMFNVVRIALLLAAYELPDIQFKEDLCVYLKTKAQVTVKYEFVDADIVDILVTDNAKVDRNASLTTVEAAVKDLVDTLFALGTVKIGVALRFSDLTRAIDEVDGLNYHALALRIRRLAGTGDSSQDHFEETIIPLDLEAHKVQVYVDTLLVAHDDGDGNFVSDHASFASGTVNYTNGEVVLDFNTAPGDQLPVYVIYKQTPDSSFPDDLVPGQKQIFRLVSKTVNVSY